MIGSFSVSSCIILTTWEIPVENKLMACLPKTFPVFSPFSFSSRCLYSAYVLLIVFFCWLYLHFLCPFFLPPNKYALRLLTAPLKHSHFLCCLIHSFAVSTVSPKNSWLFSILSASVIIFLTCQNRHHMTNNTRCKGNINHTFVIIFLIGNLPSLVISW